jgi:hypothetical protein
MEMMLATLAHLESEYGSVRAYLGAGGLTDAEIARLVRRLRSE